MMTPCRARNVISLILLAGLIAHRDARPVEPSCTLSVSH